MSKYQPPHRHNDRDSQYNDSSRPARPPQNRSSLPTPSGSGSRNNSSLTINRRPPTPPTPENRRQPPDSFDHNADALTVQRYFNLFSSTLDINFEQRAAPQSIRGGPQQSFIAHLSVPMPHGMSVQMRAEGSSKKTAKQMLMHAVKSQLEQNGWMAVAEGAKRPRRDGGMRSPRGRPSASRHNQRPTSTVRTAGDSWDTAPIKPIPRATSGADLSQRHTPSAWDDDANTQATGRRNVMLSEPSARDTWRVPSQQQGYQQQHQHSHPADVWGDQPSRQSFHAGARHLFERDSYKQVGNRSGPSDWRPDGFLSRAFQSSLRRDTLGRSTGSLHYQHRPEPDHMRPPPPPKARLPADVDDGEKKFIRYYCTGNKLAVPPPNMRHLPARRRETGMWQVQLRLPAHVFEGQQINDIVGLGQAKVKKTAIVKAWQNLCAHLMAIVDQPYVDIFRLHVIPFKKRLQSMLAEPIRIELTESALTRLDNMLSQLKDSNAFDFEEPKPDVHTVDESLGFVHGVGRLGTVSADTTRLIDSTRRLAPSDIPIPLELEKNQLPIFSKYREIVCAIENNPVTILSAETGAGKTTQLPQFLLSYYKHQRKNMAGGKRSSQPINVVVTQPRRIAAISVAQRVAYERGEVIGRNSAIGYQVRFDDKRPTGDPRDGTVVFCTSGILLKRLQEDPQLKNVTHIILDEVHERDLNTDLLLIIVRQLLQKRPDIRVVLMSATAETELFQGYFRGYGTEGRQQHLPPIIHVKGRMFPVRQYLLEDVDKLLRESRALPQPFRPTRESSHWVANETGPMVPPRGEDPVPYDYLEALIAHICTTRDEGAILCFLPGWQEIDQLAQRLKDEDNFRVGFKNEEKFRIFPLHSSVPTSSQQLIFETPPKGVRKVILSTNIAETSVTINDVVYVIDSGKLRINSYDADRRISSLSSVWASLSNLRQRTGRAGRCQPGLYFSLLSNRRKQTLPYSMPPELLRVDLQSTVLKVKALRLTKHVEDVFSAAPQPPSPASIRSALQELQALGAIDADENLTSLGQVLSNMPVDPWIGKMVLEAAVMGCLDPILTIAGGMEIGRGIFAIHPEEKEQGRAHILSQFAMGTESDHLTMLNAFSSWKKVFDENGGGLRSFVPAAKEYARANYLHHNSLSNVERARQQLLRVLEDSGLVERRRRNAADSRGNNTVDLLGGATHNTFATNNAMIRAILCGALYPNVAEVAGKDEYRSRTDFNGKLRLTSSSVNSWKGVVNAGTGAASVAKTGRATPANSTATSDIGDYDTIPDDDNKDDADSLELSPTVPPLPPRLLAFQDKQRVDGGLYLRNTTRIDGIALLLFADAADVRTTFLSEMGRSLPGVSVDNWIRIGVRSPHELRVMLELRTWLGKYLKWAVWSKQRGYSKYGQGSISQAGGEQQRKWETLGRFFVREIAGILPNGDM